MKENFYGRFEQTDSFSEEDCHVENILLRGFTIITDLFTPNELSVWRQKIDAIYQKQEAEFGRDALDEIK